MILRSWIKENVFNLKVGTFSSHFISLHRRHHQPLQKLPQCVVHFSWWSIPNQAQAFQKSCNTSHTSSLLWMGDFSITNLLIIISRHCYKLNMYTGRTNNDCHNMYLLCNTAVFSLRLTWTLLAFGYKNSNYQQTN